MPNLEQRAVTEWLTELRPTAASNEWPPLVRAIETETDNPERLQALGSLLDWKTAWKSDPAWGVISAE